MMNGPEPITTSHPGELRVMHVLLSIAVDCIFSAADLDQELEYIRIKDLDRGPSSIIVYRYMLYDTSFIITLGIAFVQNPPNAPSKKLRHCIFAINYHYA